MKLSFPGPIPSKITTDKFLEKVSLICDPYCDREFFTNLIYCLDRQKSIRDVFEAALDAVLPDVASDSLDSAFLHFFYSYQAANSMRENYQWLPMAQGLYALMIQRGDGQKPLFGRKVVETPPSKAMTPAEFESAIRRDVRKVEPRDSVWQGLLFLLENRSTRSQAVKALIRTALVESDPLTFELIVKAVDLSLSSGWRSQNKLLWRAFNRFWSQEAAPEVVVQGLRLSKSQVLTKVHDAGKWSKEWTEDLWRLASTMGAESAWSQMVNWAEAGANIDQLFSALSALRARTLYAMSSDQWPRVAASLVYGDALQSAARWLPEEADQYLAISLVEFSKLARLLGEKIPDRPTGKSVLDGASKNISKDRLVLRLDDCVERGAREEALELMAAILKDEGLSHSIADRLMLMAAKQDGFTFHMRTLPMAFIISRGFESCRRLGVTGLGVEDALFGLLRFLSDQRDISLEIVQKTGTYGDGLVKYQGEKGVWAKAYGYGGLPLSQYDVSGGARIVDRFVFNQIRNAQRVKLWPSDN